MKKKIIAIVLMTTVMISICTPMSFAASSKKTKKMTTYSVIKKGDTVYCQYGGIYKVNLKTGTTKKIVSNSYGDLRLHKGYIYYLGGVGGEYYRSKLCRLKLSNNKSTTLFKNKGSDIDYAISGSKIYINGWGDKKYKKVMKLNGKSKKSSKVKVKMKYKESNAAGYSIKQEDFYNEYDDEEYEYSIVYLVTPNGKIELLRGYDDGEGVE